MFFFVLPNGLFALQSTPDAPLRVLLISRRPYDKYIQHSFVGRQLDNEDELVEAMRGEAGVALVKKVDMVQLTFQAQLALMAGTDVLVGMHGAALSHVVYLPPWAGVMELWPKDHDMWRCFEHLTQLTGPAYQRWENKNDKRFRKDRHGDYTLVEVDEFMNQFRQLIDDVTERRKRMLTDTVVKDR